MDKTMVGTPSPPPGDGTALDRRAKLIYLTLKVNLNRCYKLPMLLDLINEHRVPSERIHDSKRTRAAIRRARQLATDDGLCFPVACPANGFTYCVTDDPSAVFDPSLHLGRIAQGVGVRKEVHDEFMRKHLAKLPKSERDLVVVLDKLHDRVAAVIESEAEMTRAIVAMRRASRQDSDPTA